MAANAHHKIEQFTYASGGYIPAGYRCTECDVHGVKLWREYQTCGDYTALTCAVCTVKSQSGVTRSVFSGTIVADDGTIDTGHGRNSAIGWRVPAVPTEDGETFWGYTSIPDEGVKWWRQLPTRKG